MKNLFVRNLRLLIVMLLMSPVMLFAQNNPGDNPDARPQDVPFDGTMSWILIGAGIVLSVIVLRKVLRKKATV